MAIQYINTGSSANAGNGDSLRSAFVKVNNNFTYLSTATGGAGYTGSRGNIGYTGSASAGYTGSQGNIGYTGSAPNLPSIANTATNAGSIAYYNTTGTIKDATKLLFNDRTGSLSILGSGTGTNVLYVRQTGYMIDPILTTAQYHDTVDAINFTWLRARGTNSSPLPVQLGDEIAELSWEANDSTSSTVAGALIAVLVDQTPTSGHVPMSFRFITDNGTDFNTRMFISSTGTVRFNRLAALANAAIANTIEVGSNFIPTANLAYDLGSTSSQWRSLYVGTSTIYLGGTALSVADGNLTVDGTEVIVGTTSTLATTYTSSNIVYVSDAFNSVTVQTYNTITTGTNVWYFDTNGWLTFPDNSIQTTAYRFVTPPAASTSTGTVGMLAQDASYLYVCTATNTWQRIGWDTNPW